MFVRCSENGAQPEDTTTAATSDTVVEFSLPNDVNATPAAAPATPPASPEPVEDPATATITAGKETVIEIQKGKSGLGLSIVGGADTMLVSGCLTCALRLWCVSW